MTKNTIRREAMRRIFCVLLLSFILVFDASAEIVHNNESHTLCIHKPMGGSIGDDAFKQLYPNVILESIGHLTKDDIYTMVLTQSAQVDIFGSNTFNLPAYHDLISRGFYAPIESEKLRKFAENSYPGVRDIIFVDDKLVGIPVWCLQSYQIGIEMSMWHALGLDDSMLPRSWLDLIDFIKNQWPTLSAGYPDWCAIHSEDYMLIFYELLSSYLVYRQQSPVDPGYNTDVFRDTMNEYLSVSPNDFDNENDEKQALISAKLQVSPATPNIYSDTHYTFVPIDYNSNTNATALVTLGLMVINPYSNNHNLCEAYLECLVDNIEPIYLAFLQKEYSTPSKMIGWDEFAAEYKRTVDKLNESIDLADDDAEKAALQLQLDAYVSQTSDVMNNPWYISEESIREFKSLVDDLFVLWDDALNERESQLFAELCDNVHRRTIPVEFIIDRLDRLYYLSTLED